MIDIQPLRFYIDEAKNVAQNYYEKEKFNVGHTLCWCPDDKLIPFAFNIPTTVNFISSAKLYCQDGTTVKYDFKARLKNATDLKIISFTDPLTLITQHRLRYMPSDGFVTTGAVKDYIPGTIMFMRIVLTHPVNGITLTYRSDLIQIFNYTDVNTLLLDNLALIGG